MTEQKQGATQLIETNSTKFVAAVSRQFAAEIGSALAFTEYEKTLAQHLFVKIDNSLKEFEAKRNDQNKPAYIWANVNMNKLAIDAVHRVNLGLDALIPNHIHTIPYLNGATKKYDIDLQIGYAGKDFYRRDAAIDKPVGVIYELVYSTDVFKPHKKSLNNQIESYEFEITNPFNRGNVIGGFGYVMYAEPRNNFLVIVTEDDFKKSESAAKSKEFWNKYPVEMRFKTLVNRTTAKLNLDPRKVNSKSYAYVEGQEQEDRVQREIAEHANSEVIDINPEDAKFTDAEPTAEQSQGEKPAESTDKGQTDASTPEGQKQGEGLFQGQEKPSGQKRSPSWGKR